MVVRYRTGEEIRKGDRVLLHREGVRVELVVCELGDPETEWYVREYGGGVMILEGPASRTFITVDRIEEYEDLRFVSRADGGLADRNV